MSIGPEPGLRLAGLLVLLAPLLALCPGAQAQPAPVGVDAVRREPMSQRVPVIGRLVALQSGTVAARTAGPVAQMRVQVGDHVEAGQAIAVLNRHRLEARRALQEAELRELQARVATAQASETLARQQLRRLEGLRGSAAFNQSLYDTRVQELEAARASHREAEARLVRGGAALELVDIELRDTTVRAPYPGTVTVRHTSAGAWVDPGDPVVTLVNDAELEIEADVPAERLVGLRPGQRVEVIVAGGGEARHRARIRAIVPDENVAARTRPLRLVPEFSEPPPNLARNQPVTLLLPATAQDEVVTVHKDAVLRRPEGAVVFRVEDGLAQPRPVRLGEAVGARLRVIEGLAPGDLVVVRGNERLRPGQAVEQHRAAPADPG